MLLLAFNRPATTRKVFEAIREARPPRLYVAVDGPRGARAGEALLCNEVRDIVSQVDWPCRVETLFRERNLGCKIGVSAAIDWFFSLEPEGIILEDDVLPESCFFEFCDELLDRYRDDERVAAVSGCNLISGYFKAERSYFFSRYPCIWGWASWRRAWQHYDVRMATWPEWRNSKNFANWLGTGSLWVARYWRRILDAVYGGSIDTWDYQWNFACWRAGSLTILPAINLTTNLGFGADATHTISATPAFVSDSVARPLPFPLIHPESIEREIQADALIDSKVLGINAMQMLKRRFQILRKLKIVKVMMQLRPNQSRPQR